ncbi:minor capsid protein [Tropicibacter sp. R15_0]|uniref:minor capsid protein n=1 Tax=Tropicibacter sp. R15_0 TaxID=2821101 RepID=UPI001ADC3A4D|nr:minor capsid protein [Tropicibacter sp. R15_0]MBO9468458.1 minor capsid protein [Tropicibacter sp. R15_0]
MQHSFDDFLRRGDNGQYVIAKKQGHLIGKRVGVSLKSNFPNYTALRADFSDRLDEVIAHNTRTILNALTPPDTVPTVTEADLRNVSDAKQETLDAWDTRLAHYFSEYQNHPQRLRPLRIAMEERLVRAFAGLINQLRQESLGIVQYVWRSQEDAKVRDSHAARHGHVFRWDAPPDGGHPGEEHNCRCRAVPLAPDVPSIAVLADFAPAADAIGAEPQIGGFWRGLSRRFPAVAGLLSLLEEQERLSELSDPAVLRQEEAASRLGLDITTEEGGLAAWAHQSYSDSIFRGAAPFFAPTTREAAEIAGQAAALYELMNPGAITGLDPAASAGMAAFVEQALREFEAGHLGLEADDWAQGWVEVFPELTEDERRLGQLPGFTPERIEQWLETYPIEDLGLPNHTGSPIPGDPTDNIISTPIPEETGPNIVAMADPNNSRATALEESTFERIKEAFPRADIERNREYRRENGELDGEVDTLVNGIPVEVTIGVGGDKLRQAKDIERLTGEAPIIYGPRVRGTVERNLRREGYDLVRDLDSLIEALRNRGIDP